jgi:hypothetical protein
MEQAAADFECQLQNMPRRIYFPNFNFEEELTTQPNAVSSSTRRVLNELAPVIGLLDAESGSDMNSIVLVEEGARPGGLPQLLASVEFCTQTEYQQVRNLRDEFVPWGWSPRAIAVAEALGFSQTETTQRITAAGIVNSRVFHSPWDLIAAVNRPSDRQSFGSICSTMTDLNAAVASFTETGFTHWVIKANVSHAARNRLVGSGDFTEAQQKWIQSRFRDGEKLAAEPWVRRIAECGLQYEIQRSADSTSAIRFLGAAEMLTDAAGRYRGSILRPETRSDWWLPAADYGLQIAQAASDRGFSGPLGLDCMLFESPRGGPLCLRYCHDINGRLTMGRLALALRKHLQAGETALWFHAPSEKSEFLFRASDVENVRLLATSPLQIGAQPITLMTGLLVSRHERTLVNTARQILGQDVCGFLRERGVPTD